MSSHKGFWTENPFAPTWRGAFNVLWRGGSDASELCVKEVCETIHIVNNEVYQDINIQEATSENAEEIAEFLQKWYRNTPRARCVVQPQWIRDCLGEIPSAENRWNHCLLARCIKTKKCIGTIVQWNTGWLRMKDGTIWPSARCIDYLCVAAGWRRKGIARRLLHAIHTCAVTDASKEKKPFPPHLFCLEQSQFNIPSLTWTSLVARHSKAAERGSHKIKIEQHLATDEITGESIWRMAARAGRICSLSPLWNPTNSDTKIVQWKPDLFFLITDTFHITVPDGNTILVLDSLPRIPTAEELEGFIDEGLQQKMSQSQRYLILCAASWPRTHPAWESDASVQWISYNLQTGPIPDSQPPLLLL